ncbi:hypothetical protein HPB49_006863 [Dermacentor silvarum]|uniref:Uncharacterized protein n=1 Tax=Dermacentor silvarum TaxID=543639 RepID=A0ACB8DWU9_DERSI|nr:hypothetical protein HPB49_006863 [Dermacentor silvarum]
MKRLELEILRAQNTGEATPISREREKKMKDLMQSYRVGQDVGLLVNFERTCDKAGFLKDSWPQRLLTLLPCEVADVIARMGKEESEDYDKV